MTDEWDELPDHEEARGENGGQMKSDSDAVDAGAVPIPFARGGAARKATLGSAGDAEVGESG